MVEAAKPECTVDMKVDTYVVNHWYADDVSNQVKEFYDEQLKDNSKEDAFNIVKEKYSNFKEETLVKMCDGTFDVLEENI